MVLIGIDPGISGAIGSLIIGPARVPVLHVVADMPVFPDPGTGRQRVNCAELKRVLTNMRGLSLGCEVWVENVSAMPGQGVSSSFGFGRTLGNIEAVVACCDMTLRYVHSSVWKKAAGLKGKPKDASRALAQQEYPQADLRLKKHEGRAEALLLARHGSHDWLARTAATVPAP